jgi:hypothetical protein
LRALEIKIGKGEPELSPALQDTDPERVHSHVFTEDLTRCVRATGVRKGRRNDPLDRDFEAILLTGTGLQSYLSEKFRELLRAPSLSGSTSLSAFAKSFARTAGEAPSVFRAHARPASVAAASRLRR